MNGRLIGAATMAVALLAGDAAGGTAVVVDIKDFAFAPAVITVPAGTTVTWTNDDEEPHTVTSTRGVFGSEGLAYHETFAQTFATAGRYEYVCALHPHMKATVIVR
jgi:plastocyanin